jgi:ribose 5-phosphate isomerase A
MPGKRQKTLSQEDLKKMCGYRAVDDYVKSGMVIGLGTGSTAYHAVNRVGEKIKSGELKDIIAIPTSIRTKEQAESLGIPLVSSELYCCAPAQGSLLGNSFSPLGFGCCD